MEWKDISVFISSTFNDMHAERDLLLKKVFPVLSEWCARRRIRIYDIDLRWGVTSADSASNNTVEVCLKRVDDCRPFFLCFIGQRRGYIPPRTKISDETILHYPGLSERIGKDSVTEMEIEHALLAPMLSLVDNRNILPEPAKHSVFFIRDGAYVADLNDEQHMFFTNADAEDEAATDAAQASFVSRVRREWSDVHDYTCRFDRSIVSTELLGKSEVSAQGRLTDFMVGEIPMDQYIIEALKRHILEEYPDRAQEISDDEEEPESEKQEQKAVLASSDSIEREMLTRDLEAYCMGSEPQPLFVYGKSGSGKTTLLARFVEEKKKEKARDEESASSALFDQYCLRFCGISPSSTRWTELWNSILLELGISDEGENADAETREGFQKILRAIEKKGKTLLVIDGIDELNEGLSVLSYLPAFLPEGLRLILSFRSDREDAEAFLEHMRLSGAKNLRQVDPLSGNEEISTLIKAYLSHYLKAFDDEHIEALCEIPASRNPLFLKIILRELRVFGSRRQLIAQINEYGDTPSSAFAKVLADMEKAINYTPIRPATFVPALMGTLARVRGSIRFGDLKRALMILLCENEESVSDTLAFYVRRLRPYLLTDGDRIGLSYRTLMESALARYEELADAQHDALAEVFFDGDPLECLYHYRMAKNYATFRRLTGSVSFLLRVIRRSGAVSLLSELSSAQTEDEGSVEPEVLACLRNTAALIGRDVHIAAALMYKEIADPEIRKEAAGLCDGPWLRYEPVELTIPDESGHASISTGIMVEHAGCQGFSLAAEKKIAYILKGEREIAVVRLADASECTSFDLSGSGRIRKITCTADGSILAAVSEDLTLTLFRVTLDDTLRLIALSAIYTDQCGTVRFGGVSLFSSGDAVFWQRPDGMLVRFVSGDGNVVPGDGAKAEELGMNTGKLVGASEEGTIWKNGGEYILRLNNGKEITASARINAVKRFENKLWIAAENRTLMAVDPDSRNTVGEYPLGSESAVSLSICGDALYGADRYGALIRLLGGEVEELGRITQGDAIIDMNAEMLALEPGKMAYVSMQRRAVLLTEGSEQRPRLQQVCPLEKGIVTIWDAEKTFTAVFPDGRQVNLPYPELLLSGRNINEKNNLRIACSEETILYEDNGNGVRIYGPTIDVTSVEKGISEMGGLVCDIQFAQETGHFVYTTYTALFCEITEDGRALTRSGLPRSESNLYSMCVCGRRTAVLSRRVRAREAGAVNDIIIDVLTMFEDGQVIWKRDIPRRADNVNGLLYDGKEDHLVLFYSTDRIEILSARTGDLEEEKKFPILFFLQGAAIADGRVFSVDHEGTGSRLKAGSLRTGEEISLPSHRRVKKITPEAAGTSGISGKEAVLVQEGDEKLYRVLYEEGKNK